MDAEDTAPARDEITYRELSGAEVALLTPELAEVLIDCVEAGASVGFMLPLERARAERFWRSVAEATDTGARRVFVAECDAAIVGTVQLITELPENQPHRGEIAKMLVRRSARRRGIGRELMRRAEVRACELGKTLLVLDTANADAERLYASVGWRRVGTIPNFALMPDGSATPTAFFYRDLAAEDGGAAKGSGSA